MRARVYQIPNSCLLAVLRGEKRMTIYARMQQHIDDTGEPLRASQVRGFLRSDTREFQMNKVGGTA